MEVLYSMEESINQPGLVDFNEAVCDRCGGIGSVIVSVSFYRGHKRGTCPKCEGTGKLDWIERVISKREDN
jgi:DnaJ-class molecular chaperone